MRKMTMVVAAMMLSLTGCQTCSNWTRSITGHVKGAFSGMGNCRMGGAHNVGAPCDAGCEAPMAPVDAGCSTCPQSAGYGGYEGTGVSYDGGVVTGVYDGIPTGSSISSSPSISSSAIPSGSYLGSPTPANRGEVVHPKPAN